MPPAQRFVACRFSIFQSAIRVQQPSAVFSRFFLFHAIPEPFQSDFYLLSEKFHHNFSRQRNDHSNRGNHIDSCKKTPNSSRYSIPKHFSVFAFCSAAIFHPASAFRLAKNRINRNANPKMLMPTPAFSPGSSNENTTSFSPSANVIPESRQVSARYPQLFRFVYTSIRLSQRTEQTTFLPLPQTHSHEFVHCALK